ncbi:MAG: magnesium transporter CorA family protein [bacterium]|nr:magnesium transporter CorA family protein [bacterium]
MNEPEKPGTIATVIQWFALSENDPPHPCEPDTQAPVWVHVTSSDHHSLDGLSDRFHLHPLAIEDCFSRMQLPKVEVYDNVTFIVLHGMHIEEMHRIDFKRRLNLPLKDVRLHAFIGDGFLLTHSNKNSPADWMIQEIQAQRVKTPISPDELLYRLCDKLIDDSIALLEVWENVTTELESRLLYDFTNNTLDMIFQFRRHLRRIGKIALLERELFFRLSHEYLVGITPTTRVYFRDAHDHIVRLYEYTATHRESLSDALEVNLTLIANRTNFITKQLSIAAALLLPLTVITGIFGMNFVKMPWIGEPWGFWASMFLMFVVVVAMLYYFRKSHWLKK